MMECRWKNLARQAAPAKQYLQHQIDDVLINGCKQNKRIVPTPVLV